jgi:hypothetical protein
MDGTRDIALILVVSLGWVATVTPAQEMTHDPDPPPILSIWVPEGSDPNWGLGVFENTYWGGACDYDGNWAGQCIGSYDPEACGPQGIYQEPWAAFGSLYYVVLRGSTRSLGQPLGPCTTRT